MKRGIKMSFIKISNLKQESSNFHEKTILKEGQCLIVEPATLSMKTQNGVKMMGIQIMKT
jgi:hypothetical protein